MCVGGDFYQVIWLTNFLKVANSLAGLQVAHQLELAKREAVELSKDR